MNSIQNFFLQLWTDLRARHLLPVAALLLAGLIAAPIVLSKGSEEPPPATNETATPQAQPKERGPEALAQVKLEDETEGDGSSLSAFDVSNPFNPPQSVVDKAQDEAQGETGTSAPGTGTPAPTTDPGTGGTDTGGGTGGTGNNGGGDNGSGGDQGKTTEFTYVLDVTFWNNGKRRTIKGLEKLDMLPSQVNPLLIFMGVTDNAGNAVFLVDSTLEATGEGRCKPGNGDCAFLYLGAGAEEEFTTDEGDSYRLLINEIRKVKVGGESGQAAAGAKSGKTARASVGSEVARRFAFPLLTDVVAQSGSTNGNSTGADKRR
jgi:hypothetical protein